MSRLLRWGRVVKISKIVVLRISNFKFLKTIIDFFLVLISQLQIFIALNEIHMLMKI